MNQIIRSLRWGAILIGLAIDIWALGLGGSSVLASLLYRNRPVFYSSLASISATLLGFVLTAFSIVVAFAANSRFDFLKREGHLPSIYDSFFAAMTALGVTTLTSIAALLLDRDQGPFVPAFCVCITCSFWAVGELTMCLAVFRKMIKLAVQPSRARRGDQA